MQYFGSNLVEGVAESWVEVDGAECRWVHGLVIPTFFFPFEKFDLLTLTLNNCGNIYINSQSLQKLFPFF